MSEAAAYITGQEDWVVWYDPQSLDEVPGDVQVIILPLYLLQKFSIPCIAYGSPREIINAFFLGVADYLSEPWTPVELVTRARRFGGGNEIVTATGNTIRLRQQETLLWRLLFANRGTVVDRQTIAAMLEISDDPSSRAVDMAVRRLRQALGSLANEVETVRGQGYRLRISGKLYR